MSPYIAGSSIDTTASLSPAKRRSVAVMNTRRLIGKFWSNSRCEYSRFFVAYRLMRLVHDGEVHLPAPVVRMASASARPDCRFGSLILYVLMSSL